MKSPMAQQMEEKKREYDQSSDQEEQSLLQQQQLLSSPNACMASNDDVKSYESYFKLFLGENQPYQATSPSSNPLSTHFGQIMSRLQDKLIEMLRENEFIVDEEPQSINNTSKLSNSLFPFQIKLIRHTPSFQVVELYCKLGRISKKIIIHNTFNKNHIHSSQKLPTHGNFSVSYDIKFKQQTYFIKCTNFDNKKNIKPQNIIKQYFIAIIMSTLRIGPKIIKINGFDLCIYQQWNENKNKLIDKSNFVNSAFYNLECIEFMMEKCQKLTYSRKSERQLKFALLQMHALKICHVDIKPQNIMYSPAYEKAILIDFGISLSLSQGIGKKTWTKFSGTVDFASEQMRSILNKSGYVDMYCNDVFGLQKSFQKICSQKSSHKSDEEKNFFLSSQLLQRFLSCSNFNRNTQVNQYSQLVSSFVDFLDLVSQSFRKNQQVKLLDLNKQLLIQLTKYLIYCYCVKWKDNYSGKSVQLKSFQQAIFRASCLILLQGQIDFFAKELNQFQDEDWIQPLYEKKQNQHSSLFYSRQQSINFEKLYFKICNISHTNHNTISTDQQGETQTQQQKYDQIQNLSNDPESYIQKLLKKTTLLRPPSQVKTNIIRDGSVRHTFYQRNLHILSIFKKNLNKIQQSKTQKSKLLQYFSQNTVQSYLPKQNQMNKNHYEILWFYAAILDMFMNQIDIQSYQNSNKENQNTSQAHLNSQFSFLLPNMFQILKNLILLGFNFYTFLKDYLRKCLNIVLHNKFLRKHILLFVIKEFIEIGLLINYTYFSIQKSDGNIESTFKSDFLNEQLLKFDFDLNQLEFESEKEKNTLLINMKLLQKLWIYFNHQLVKFKMPYDVLIRLFTQIESSIRRSFFQLDGKQKLIWCTVYEYLLQIVKDYAIIYYIGVLNVYQRNSTVIKNSESQYQKLWNESFYIHINSTTKIQSQKESFENNVTNSIKQSVTDTKKQYKESVNKITKIKIDYFTLTNPINFINKNNSPGENISKICLKKLDAIILIPNVSIFLHLDMRLRSQFFTNNFQRFQQVSSFVLNDQVENNHQIRLMLNIVDVAIKMTKLLQDGKQSQNLVVLIVFLKKLMKNLIQIVTLTSSKAQLQNIDLLFGQVIQKFYILFSTTLSIENNRSQQNFLNFLGTKQKMLSAMNLFQSRNPSNQQVKIINLYNKHRMEGIMPRYFSEFIRYERDEFIQIMTQVCQCFLKILKQNKIQTIKQFGRGFQYLWKFFLDKILIEIIPLMLLSNSSKEKYFQLIRCRKMTQNLSSNQQQLFIANSTFYLNAQFIKSTNDQTPKQFLLLFQQYFIVHFGHQFSIDKKHRRLNINFLGLAKQALNVFKNFCRLADDQLIQHTIEEFYKIENRASISILYIYFILLEQKKQFFIKYPVEKQRMEKKIVNRLKNATQTQDINQYLEQLHLKQVEWNKIAKGQNLDEVSSIKSRRREAVDFSRIRRMIRHIPKDSFFKRSPTREQVLQFLSTRVCQSRKLINSAYTLRRLQERHKEKRLKYVEVVLEELADRDILRHYFIHPNYKQKRIMRRIDELKDKENQPQYFKSTEQFQLSQEKTHPKKEISQSQHRIIELAEKKMEKLAEQVVNKLIAQNDYAEASSQKQDKKYYQLIFTEYVTTNYQI